jgi:hypothetical protein
MTRENLWLQIADEAQKKMKEAPDGLEKIRALFEIVDRIERSDPEHLSKDADAIRSAITEQLRGVLQSAQVTFLMFQKATPEDRLKLLVRALRFIGAI